MQNTLLTGNKNTRYALLHAALVLCLGIGGCPAPSTVPLLTPEEAPLLEAIGNPPDGSYRIDPGDTLQIRYPFHAEKNQEATVRPDGKISANVAGELSVAGMTPAELEELLVERTSDHLRDPEVVVGITEYAARSVYVAGEVGKPGPISYTKGLTPLQAIISAGGFRDTAFPESVILIRATGKAAADDFIARRLDLAATLKDGTREPLSLVPHDVLFVPRSGIAEANLWVKQHLIDMVPFFRGTGLSYGIAQ